MSASLIKGPEFHSWHRCEVGEAEVHGRRYWFKCSAAERTVVRLDMRIEGKSAHWRNIPYDRRHPDTRFDRIASQIERLLP